jgi:hypothetical protein
MKSIEEKIAKGELDARKLNILRSPKTGGSSDIDSIPYLKDLDIERINCYINKEIIPCQIGRPLTRLMFKGIWENLPAKAERVSGSQKVPSGGCNMRTENPTRQVP